MIPFRRTMARIPFLRKAYSIYREKAYSIRLIVFKKYASRSFFDRALLSRRKGPVVLVSHAIAFTFPLSYAYLAGFLKQKGIDVVILFKNIDQKELVKKIIGLKPILVGFGSLYPELEEISEIIFKLNKAGRDFPIVIGGQMFSPIPEFALKLTGADFGVIGEGEIILYNLVKALQENRDPSLIGGLAVRNKTNVSINENGEYIEDLSNLPAIPYELFNADEWLQIGRWYTRYRPQQPIWRFNDRVINVHGGRGCPFKCNFCYHHSKPRYRNVADMMDEAEAALDRFDANMLYFSDDLVITNPPRILELLGRFKKLRRPISYSVSTRFDILERLEDSLLQEMRATGCRVMGLGIESGSDRILKVIGKNTTAEKILTGLERLKNVGILPTVSVMVGQHTETREDVMKSFELMRESVRVNPLIQYAVTITTPFPGSKLYDLLFEKKLIKSDEDFYRRYRINRVGEWNQVFNVSAMSNLEVIELREEMEKSFLDERRKAYGEERSETISSVCAKQQELAEAFENKSPEEKARDDAEYSAMQLKLEKEKLAAMGVT